MVNDFLKRIVAGYKYFFTALKFDLEDNNKFKLAGETVPAKWANLKNWWRLFGVFFLILVISIFSLWNLIKPHNRYPNRSHHGINKYGKRY
jgi:hypothetical protein